MQWFRVLLLIAFLISGEAIVYAQNSAVTITGAIISVKPTGPPSYKNDQLIWKNGIYERTETYFEMRVRLTFHNTGNETLIIPTPNFFIGANERVLFLDLPSKEGSAADIFDHYLTYKGGDRSNWLLKELVKTEPSTSYFTVIEPSGFYETGVTINLKGGFRVEVRKGVGYNKQDVEIAVPEHPYFRLQFAYSIKEEEKVVFREAQLTWKSLGKFVVPNSGNFLFESDVIMNKLRD